MSELTIGLILPDVLGTYGDNGNALVLRGRARKRGIDAEVVTIKLGEPVPTNLDLYCVGGGEGPGVVGPRCALSVLRACRLTASIICVTVLRQSYRRSDEAVRLRS